MELSIIEDQFVLPLNLNNYKVKLRPGNRPDTSVARIKAKTPVPDDTAKASEAIESLRSFVDKVKVVGRSEISVVGSVDLSVVDPHQYRDELIRMIGEDVGKVTSAIGPDYKVVMGGLNAPVNWTRSGPLNLLFYVPYSLRVIPSNVTSVSDFY